ncbi:MAG TPA: GNAT family N-acetyltransferase [Anaerolineae bacterium]|nr:GNAT family N-acetyltransferase [Anaerolineae bacterium]
MVAHATSDSATARGLRPINSMRDLVSITTLIENAFADDMDASGRAHMREMRWMGTLFGWMDWLASPGQGLMPGYVWVEDGHIVGNVTVRKLSAFGHGWMIGNVAVAPDWRRRGIARQMMDASIELVRHNHGEWIALQVRSDNDAACKLYQTLGFVETGEMVYMDCRAPGEYWAKKPTQITGGRLRPARASDMSQLYALAQSFIPDSIRWAEPVYRSFFDMSMERNLADWFSGERHVWRVVESVDHLCGAALLEIKRRKRWARLHLWIVPAHDGEYEEALIDNLLAEIPHSIDLMAARLPGEAVGGRIALLTRGFREVRALTSMKLTLNET